MKTGSIEASVAKEQILKSGILQEACVQGGLTIFAQLLGCINLDGCIFQQGVCLIDVKVASGAIFTRVIAHGSINLTGLNVAEGVDFTGARIGGELRIAQDAQALSDPYLGIAQRHLNGPYIGHSLILKNAIVGSLNLSGAIIIGNLVLAGATVREIDLRGVMINGYLDFSDIHGLSRIFVSHTMAELVHWAAPQASLVVSR